MQKHKILHQGYNRHPTHPSAQKVPIELSLEEALEYIKADEYVEVTPKSMRIRKVILDHLERKRSNRSEG